MSELIDNSRQRRELLKGLIQKLHDGASVDSVRDEFAQHFANVSAGEISQLEQELVENGLPVSEIQRLCDVHASVFKGSIAEIHQPQDPSQIPGHPIYVFHKENRMIEKLIDETLQPDTTEHTAASDRSINISEFVEKIWEIDKHYSRKENLLFPFLERYGVTAPPKVMWGVDDEIRTMIKQLRHAVSVQDVQPESKHVNASIINTLIDKVREMIFKEEHILFPLALEKLQQEDWVRIASESADIGFCLLSEEKIPNWPVQADQVLDSEKKHERSNDIDSSGRIKLTSGSFTVAELNQMLNTLPFDITFVDAKDTVRYFSQGQERIFTRTQAIIGRQVADCHPPASVSIVENIVNDFKSGKRDHADFWIHLGERFALIRYFAVRSEQGSYLGTLEVTQDIAPIQFIQGEKRLLDDG